MIRSLKIFSPGTRLKLELSHKLKAAPAESPPAGKSGGRRVRGPKASQGAGVQYAALPYRMGETLEILLITSRETGRWVIPKGWPMKGRKPHAVAAREAVEEAGVRGKIGKTALGAYPYAKRLANGAALSCTVEVYPLAVGRQMKQWPEQAQRTLGWFSPMDAANVVDEPQLAGLIQAFAETWAAAA